VMICITMFGAIKIIVQISQPRRTSIGCGLIDQMRHV
jgi:hypothetical protein